SLTHRLLAFARRQTLAPKPIVINGLLPDLVELVRRTVGPAIDVETIAAAGLWPSLVDANQLENAILNLCINARDAMPHGGRITIETGNKWLDDRTAQERGLEPGQYVTICVSDTGTGIEKDILDRVFDPFFTTKPIGEGTGLGLSMVYGFARQSHGHVRIYSEVGQGTMVCIYLPRHFGEAEEREGRHIAPAVPADAGQTVLVIDDEPTVRMLITDALGDLGYACIEAGDGSSGLALLEAAGTVDLLITDVGLPGGLNGRQVAEAARTMRPGLKVLFITGYAENAVLNHGHVARGMEVLTKPFAIDDLAGRVDRMLRD
ncbi:MAG: response regulator, partial [Rhizorhabdus sp.]